MDFQEYPKALYKGGDVEAEHVIVQDAEDEAAKRDEGFAMLGEEKAPARARKKQDAAQ